jgi:cytochrome c oxidase subunit 2
MLVPIVGAMLLLLTGCGDAFKRHPQNTMRGAKGPAALTIEHLINPVYAVAAVVFVVILGACLFVALKFRARDNDDFDEMPAQIHGNLKAEVGWTIGPAVILLFVGIATVATIFNLAKPPNKDAVRVEVFGQQWWWQYRYDLDGDGKYDDLITANDLVIPAGRQIALRIGSHDVIHSWWAPSLNGKKDAVPGRIHPLTIEADDPGTFVGQCTEFCGLSHANMRIKVVAMTEGRFRAWTARQRRQFRNPVDPVAQAGWQVFVGQCTTCHRINGLNDPSKAPRGDPPDASRVKFKYPKVVNQVSGVAPNLTHFASRTTFAGAMFNLRKDTPQCVALGENWAQTDKGWIQCVNRVDLEAWLRNPPAVKPMAPGPTMSPLSRGMPNLNLNELQIDQLVAFLQTLK